MPQAGRIAVGQRADLTILNTAETAEVQAQKMYSLGHNSPFIGEKVTATIQATMVAGKWVYQEGSKK